jgi:hypothetical protein
LIGINERDIFRIATKARHAQVVQGRPGGSDRLLRHIKLKPAHAGIIHFREEQQMRCEKSTALTAAIYLAAVCTAAAIPSAAHAKGHCQGNTHSKTGQWYNKSCGCRAAAGSSDSGGSYGHAEIHKRNVPTVKPSGVGPTNLARPPLGLAPRAPTPTFQPR